MRDKHDTKGKRESSSVIEKKSYLFGFVRVHPIRWATARIVFAFCFLLCLFDYKTAFKSNLIKQINN